jgi:hypothetical protein
MGGYQLIRRSFNQRQGHREVIYGIARLLASGEWLRRMGEALPERAHDPDRASFKRELPFLAPFLSADGVVNRSRDIQIQAGKLVDILARWVGFPSVNC